MRTFQCECQSELFFENAKCLSCGAIVGWCPACKTITALDQESNGLMRCRREECRQSLVPCHNYAVENVCNRCVCVEGDVSDSLSFCDYCALNETIPDLSVEGNREKWYRLEKAKRRLLYSLDLLGLPYGDASSELTLPLSFAFLSDRPPDNLWRRMADNEQVHTGHQDGKITINLREADSVERERTRIQFNESHRTLIGHFRHEIGHYYWQLLIQNRDTAGFREVFGDHENPSYTHALERYHHYGPAQDWQQRFISAYASMHPWEDFAETFSAYLNIVSVYDTALGHGMINTPPVGQVALEQLVEAYLRIGILTNELNRELGLIDLVPDPITSAVMPKLHYIDSIAARRGDAPSAR